MLGQAHIDARAGAPRSLGRKLDYFFSSRRRGRKEVAECISRLSSFSHLAVVGGMVRDLYLDGNRTFVSDIDLVAYDCSPRKFAQRMHSFGAERNRFGGYKIKLRRWTVEVWHLDQTWARKAEVAEIECLADLLRATFFDWDAILYDLQSNEIIADRSYFENVHNRLLDIRLPENPNPFGNAVRALRYAARWRALFTSRLSEHVLREIHDAGWRKVVSYDATFQKPLLSEFDGEIIRSQLRMAVDTGVAALVVGDHTSRQHNLQLRAGGVQLKLPIDNQLP